MARVPTIMASNRQPIRRLLSFIVFVLTALPHACARPRPDVIVASVPPPTIALLGMFASLTHLSPWVLILRDIEPVRSLNLRGLATRPLGHTLIRLFAWLYRRAAHLVVVHERELDTLPELKIPVRKVTVISHAIDLSRFDANAQSAQSPTIPKHPDRMRALYLGTIGKVHDLAALVRAATDDRIRPLPVDFVIIGDGECQEECVKIATDAGGDNVAFLPPVTLDQVPAVLKQADILICSHKKGTYALLGSKFYEYCAAGKPILVHGDSTATQQVEEIGNGFACTPGGIDSLHTALTDFITRPDFWREQGKHGRKFAEQQFSQRNRDEQWESLLQAALCGPAPRSGLA